MPSKSLFGGGILEIDAVNVAFDSSKRDQAKWAVYNNFW